MSKMLSKEQIRVILLHEFKLERKAVEAYENIVKAWGSDDEPRRGRIPELDDDCLKALVELDPRKTIRDTDPVKRMAQKKWEKWQATLLWELSRIKGLAEKKLRPKWIYGWRRMTQPKN
ncbi:hypothetical protein GCK32_011517 [Trichostrongylus colubriformis]|uniref:Mos1 transposase HTH domain-containing protein n=1 Tax=Trichostrongylus colubriformis TaxID=6319 RepID=A0AAN8G4X6_TRICO